MKLLYLEVIMQGLSKELPLNILYSVWFDTSFDKVRLVKKFVNVR